MAEVEGVGATWRCGGDVTEINLEMEIRREEMEVRGGAAQVRRRRSGGRGGAWSVDPYGDRAEIRRDQLSPAWA